MKKIFLIFIFLFCNQFYAQSNEEFIKNVNENEEEYSFVMIATDNANEHYMTKFNLHSLKKCDFPAGPLRNNNLGNSNFVKVTDEVINKIKNYIALNECIELSIFCIDNNDNSENKHNRVCGFQWPSKGKLCYVFNFEKELKEIKGYVLANYHFDELLETQNKPDIDDIAIDEETGNAEPLKDMPEVPRDPKWLVMLKKIGVCLFMKGVDFKESISHSYEKILSYIK